jgi:hypothetical protein
MRLRLIRIERHRLGPRLRLFGRRVHEYHVGFALLVLSPAASADASPQLSPGKVVAAIVGLRLVVKDWPDLFKATRDKASWRWGLHRLPPGEGRAFATLCHDRWLGWFNAAFMGAAAATATLRRITSSSPRKQSSKSQNRSRVASTRRFRREKEEPCSESQQ